jgi:uroporphyrinogen III methyltransferase/synthase
MKRQTGTIYFVGAGSGDPDYLTVKAMRLLREADVVAYDDLVHPTLLEEAPASAELLAIGYRAHSRRTDHPLSQLVLDRLLNGKNVVRLKAGDPMLFARTHEEIEGLAPYAIPYEIVPGISALFGAAASFSLPLTHRGVASGIRISAGNHATADGAAPETLGIYMPRKKLRETCGKLLEEGRSADTPACFIHSASTPLERKYVGTLATLPDLVEGIRSDLPGLVIIGDVVSLADKDPRGPGQRIAVARSRPGVSRIGSRLLAKGYDVVHLPFLKYADDGQIISKAIKLATPVPDAIVIPHSKAARIFLQHDYGFALAGIPIYVLGPETAAVLQEAGLDHLIVRPDYEAILEIL